MLKETPDLLLEQILELQSIISKHRASNPNSPSLQFYERHMKILHLCYNYMIDASSYLERNAILQQFNDMLSQRVTALEKYKNGIETIIGLKAENKFDEAVDLAESVVNWNIELRKKNKPELL